MKRYFLSALAILVTVQVSAQEFSKFSAEDFSKEKNYGYFNYIQLMLHGGNHATGSDYLRDIFSNGYAAASMRIGTQSTGRKEWQRLHNYPQYGLGVAYFNLGGEKSDSAVGSPAAVYFYFGAPLVRFHRFSLIADLEIGLSYDFNPYDPEINQFQDVIASRTNLHFCLDASLNYQLSDRMDLILGTELYHFSNGRTFSPQKGINLIGLTLGAAYHFNPVRNYTKYIDPDYRPPLRPEFIIAEKPFFRPHHEFQFTATMGTVQARPGEFKDNNGNPDTTLAEGPRYITSTISAEYAYQFGRRIKGVTGIDLFYDGSAEYLYNNKLPQNTDFSDKAFYGHHVGFHYLIERFAFVYNLGWYLYKPFPQRGSWYMRAGGKIGLTDNLDVHIVLKTRNGGIADWIEWGLSYKLKLN